MAVDADGYEIVTMVDATVTCAKTGCPNKAKAIKLKMAEGGKVVCGPCGSDITPEA